MRLLPRVIPVTAVLLLLSAAPAGAEDDVKDVSAMPWSGAVLKLAEEKKRFEGAIAIRAHPTVLVHIEASAPLDEESRLAPFLEESSLASGFAGAVSVEWSPTAWNRLAAKHIGPEEVDACERVSTARQEEAEAQARKEGATKSLDSTATEAAVKEARKKAELTCSLSALCALFKLDKPAQCTAASALRELAIEDARIRGFTAPQVEQAAKQAEARQRAREQLVIPSPSQEEPVHWSLGAELAGNYDLIRAYPSTDISLAQPEQVSSYSATGGLVGRMFAGNGFAGMLRVGGGTRQKPTTSGATRCENVTSSNPDSVSGKSCKDVVVLRESPKATADVYARMGFNYTLFNPDDPNGLAPGAETWFNFEHLTEDSQRLFEFRFLLYLAPAAGSLRIRSGVGLSYQAPIGGGNSDQPQTFSPFGFIAANFDIWH